MRNEEHNAQVALFRWAALEQRRMPELALMFAVPNGGNRNIITALKLKAEGVKAGVPDIFLPCARSPYNGIFIEMKAKGRNPRGNQLWWHNRLAEQGYYVAVCYGFDQACYEIENYLKGCK